MASSEYLSVRVRVSPDLDLRPFMLDRCDSNPIPSLEDKFEARSETHRGETASGLGAFRLYNFLVCRTEVP